MTKHLERAKRAEAELATLRASHQGRRVMAKLTEAQRETAAQMLASQMMETEWRDLRPFTRARYRTAILTMERIFAAALSEQEKA